jgi:hypothetical protein
MCDQRRWITCTTRTLDHGQRPASVDTLHHLDDFADAVAVAVATV